METKKFYVTMTDKFMSGWGQATDKTNKYVIECDTYQQAELVAKNAERRSEMKYINICSKKPYYGRNYVVSMEHFNDLGEIWKRN